MLPMSATSSVLWRKIPTYRASSCDLEATTAAPHRRDATFALDSMAMN
jgi:hypothetical protein